ncbi:MAG TPA: DUF4159 domain-containing protein [Rhizomicrobium sp.]|nr:DUF4159 domain-containing protein [Rhizomicrobium sp.]
MGVLGSLSFGAPWILAALVLLPAIWFLLRVTPPSPKRVVFPPLRLLQGLKDTEETPARTPLWLLILRLIAAAAIILALAEPMLGQPARIAGNGPIVLFVDNGWTAAHGWEKKQAFIADVIRSAAKDGRAVALVATAGVPNTDLLDAGEAARRASALTPEPWAGDRARAADALAKTKFTSKPQILWLSDGTEDNHARETAATLTRVGNVRLFSDTSGPLAVLPPTGIANGISANIVRAGTDGVRNGTLEAEGMHGEILATAPFRIEDGKTNATAKITLPLQVRNEIARLAVANEDSAGAVQIFDSGAPRRAIGLVAASNVEGEQPLLSDTYYLEKALAPYGDLHKGNISRLLDDKVSVLVLADIGKIADSGRVAKFVNDGGLLIRFAGERMTGAVDDLVPVKLRVGGRYLGGALAWAEPQHLAPFADNSPFNGLSIPNDVTVSRQVLAEPSVQLSNHTWARLADGTPLVTAAQRGKGWIVLFHISANPAWSSLPLSGLYVDMLRRLLMLANGTNPAELASAATLPALETLDGFGRLHPPEGDVLPLRASALSKTAPSRTHPPGLYGVNGAAFALNVANANTMLLPMGDVGVAEETYAKGDAIALEPPLLILAMLLILADALISFGLRGLLPVARFAGVIALAMILSPHDASADDAFDLKAANDTRLAYVVTGLPDVDAMSKAGLTGLAAILKQRTSYAAGEPIGVDIAHDDLSFFPLLYWPMDPREKDLPPQVLSRLSDYMRNGGTIFFDTRDLTLGATRGATSPGEQTLRRLTSKLDLPPLEPLPQDHVLTKTFYLLREFPGRWDGGKVWVEALPPEDKSAGAAPARGGDGVSPVIIGSNDWAAAWAIDAQGQPIVDVTPGGGRQRELAYRFGVNLVMYTLTGNYKADQVHVPALLQRLGH